jgi:hypothetical protein
MPGRAGRALMPLSVHTGTSETARLWRLYAWVGGSAGAAGHRESP